MIEAVNYGINRIKELPVCTRLIKEIHTMKNLLIMMR